MKIVDRYAKIAGAALLALGFAGALAYGEGDDERARNPRTAQAQATEPSEPGVLDRMRETFSDDRAESFDHGAFDEILGKYVHDGLLDYEALAKDDRNAVTRLVTSSDRARFESYVESLAEATPESVPSTDDRRAFWINAYNAFVIKGVLDADVKTGVRDLDGFFNKRTYTAMGRTMTLDDIETTMLGGDLVSPEVALALVKGTYTSPPLQPYAYRGPELQMQLRQATSAFLNDPVRNRILRDEKRMQLSPVLEERRDRIERTSGKTLEEFVAGYLKPPIPIEELGAWKVEFRDANPALNRVPGRPS